MGTAARPRRPLPPGSHQVESERAELLVRLLSRCQEGLFRYIFALLPHEEDARDVLQETCVALCRKFDEYELDRPFLPWACRFAYLEVLKQRERNHRGSRLLSQELLERLVAERVDLEPTLDARLQALDHCLHQLPRADQALIEQRYRAKSRTEELVRTSGASRRTLFRNLDRIRRSLMDCISRRVAELP
jgi:RNA polymerase sigma-70 factor, ECF subfamily